MRNHILLFLLPTLMASCATQAAVEDPSREELSASHKAETSLDAISASHRAEPSQEGVCETDFDGSYLYGRFNEVRSEGPLIPGLLQDLVPQGMAVIEERETIVISNYSSEGRAGALTFLTADSGLLSKVLYLMNNDGSAHTGHLGGLAAGDDYLWIASGKGVYNLPYALLDKTPDGGELVLPDMIRTETKGSFATFADGFVWIGEFTRANGDYPVPETHWRRKVGGGENRAWLGAYSPGALLTGADTVFPEKILSIPHEVQGALFSDDRLILSMSFGRKNKSRLELFDLPPDQKPDEKLKGNGRGETPLWILDKADRTDQLILPPMSEAVALMADNIAVLFESGAAKYRDTADHPLDRIQYIPLKRIGEP